MLSILRRSNITAARSLLLTTRFYSAQAAPAAAPAAKPKGPISSCPAGTVIKGLNIRKGQDPIVARPDEEYPEWLWTVLDKKAQDKRLEQDPIKAARKLRRQENRKKIKDNNFLAKMSK
ncbi:mitochondrial 54S ribosomal protein mL54 [Magnusiomyces paraingens]|uniref:Large ribosomal subunit protein mL54 n=1 Tax=Magnusiomyces paraingens TaxID=2606893 RepID=A0A5E8BZD7_9ASCO|nr:uncharacterized protein SAPINGB_P005300 [Saprochaete ingens]VVT56813.1 unnamed protein product [Saprochaete ingens]